MAFRLVLVLFLLAPAVVKAAKTIEVAEQLLAKMEYKKALNVVGRIMKSPRSQPQDLAAAYRLQAMCMIGLGKTKKAIESFRKLLAIQPSYRMPMEASPSTKAPFYKAQSMGGMKPIALSHKVPELARQLAGRKLHLMVESNPFGMIHAIRLRFKIENRRKWRTLKVKVKRAGRVTLVLPKKLRVSKIRYFFEAVNRKGGVLARAGSKDHPFIPGRSSKAPEVAAAPAEPAKASEVKAAPPEPAKAEKGPKEKTAKTADLLDFETTAKEEKMAEVPKQVVESTPVVPPESRASDVDKKREEGVWYQTWWFWTAAGVVVAGVATGVAVGVTAGDSDRSSAYDIHLNW